MGFSPLGGHMQGESLPQKRGGGRTKVCWLFTAGRQVMALVSSVSGLAASDGGKNNVDVDPLFSDAPA